MVEIGGGTWTTLEEGDSEKLETLSPRKADIVKMRVVWGLTLEQIAASLEISPSTVDRDWRVSKAWLAEEVRLGTA